MDPTRKPTHRTDDHERDRQGHASPAAHDSTTTDPRSSTCTATGAAVVGPDTTGRSAPARPEPGETFHFLAWSWDITTAKTIAHRRTPNGRLRPDTWSGYLVAVRIDEDHIDHADLSAPLIAVPIPNAGLFIIDGWHRIARALRDHVPHLPVVILTAEEEYDCRLRGGDKPPATWIR